MSGSGAGLHSPPGAFLQRSALTWLHPLQKRCSVPAHRAGTVIQSRERREGQRCQSWGLFPVFSDGLETKSLTDQQLMVIAKLFGRQWREIAIECLQMEMKDLEQIRAAEEEVNMQKFLMLSKWRDREQSNGTAEALHRSLREKASYEILQALEGIAFPLGLSDYGSVLSGG